LKNVIQPTNPDGCILKIDLGSKSFNDLAAEVYPNPLLGGHFHGETTATYTVDNIDWVGADNDPEIPFSDERTYISTGEPGGTDAYSPQTTVLRRADGRYWIFFYMVGYDDAFSRGGGAGAVSYASPSPIYETLRIFEYEPATEKARQLIKTTCILQFDTEVPRDFWTMSDNLFQIFTITQIGDLVTVYIHGMIFSVRFCEFFLSEVGGSVPILPPEFPPPPDVIPPVLAESVTFTPAELDLTAPIPAGTTMGTITVLPADWVGSLTLDGPGAPSFGVTADRRVVSVTTLAEGPYDFTITAVP
jgi:hypothetical protein